MKKILIALTALCMVGSVFAESLKYTSNVKGIQNEIVNYILTDDDLPYTYKLSYYEKFLWTDENTYAAAWSELKDDWQEDENLSEFFEYAVKASHKFTYAAITFGHDNVDRKKIDNFYKKNKADKNGYYTKVLYNPGEILDGYYVLLETFYTWDNNSRSTENMLTVVQIKKSADFITYID